MILAGIISGTLWFIVIVLVGLGLLLGFALSNRK